MLATAHYETNRLSTSLNKIKCLRSSPDLESELVGHRGVGGYFNDPLQLPMFAEMLICRHVYVNVCRDIRHFFENSNNQDAKTKTWQCQQNAQKGSSSDVLSDGTVILRLRRVSPLRLSLIHREADSGPRWQHPDQENFFNSKGIPMENRM